MIYELKKYVPNPGKGAAMKERFANVSVWVFARVGIRVLHCFEDPAEPDALYYITSFPSASERDAAWKAFGADPQWKAAKAASEVDGPLLQSQTTLELHPTAFSPGEK
jgi:NIPSNAP